MFNDFYGQDTYDNCAKRYKFVWMRCLLLQEVNCKQDISRILFIAHKILSRYKLFFAEITYLVQTTYHTHNWSCLGKLLYLHKPLVHTSYFLLAKNVKQSSFGTWGVFFSFLKWCCWPWLMYRSMQHLFLNIWDCSIKYYARWTLRNKLKIKPHLGQMKL